MNQVSSYRLDLAQTLTGLASILSVAGAFGFGITAMALKDHNWLWVVLLFIVLFLCSVFSWGLIIEIDREENPRGR